MIAHTPARWVLPIALAAGLLSACSPSSDKAADSDEPRSVKVVTVQMRPLGSGLVASGRLVSREEVAVSTQLTGYQVKRVLVDQGATVKQDEVLAELDDTLLVADIGQLRAAVIGAKVALEKANQEADRATRLKGSGAMSQEATNTRLLAAQTAQAALAQAQAALDAQTLRQKLMTIKAPVSGRILSRAVRPGDISSPAMAMFRIASGDEVEVDAEIPERSIDLITVGQGADVTLQSGKHVRGTVRLVSAEIDRDTKLGRARVLLPVRDDLRPGGFASVVFDHSDKPVRAVREGAVRYTSDGASMMIVGAGDHVSTVPVALGRRAGGYVEILDGPEPGARALVGAQGFVLDGDQVTPVSDAADAGQ